MEGFISVWAHIYHNVDGSQNHRITDFIRNRQIPNLVEERVSSAVKNWCGAFFGVFFGFGKNLCVFQFISALCLFTVVKE